jgi:hypothetical protein
MSPRIQQTGRGITRTGIRVVDENRCMTVPLDGRGASDHERFSGRRRVGLGLAALAAAAAVLTAGACASDEEKMAREVAAWPMRGNLAGDSAVLDAARKRLDDEGRQPDRFLLATTVQGVDLLIAVTKHDGTSFAALYGRTGTPVPAMRLVDLGQPVDSSSLSLGIDNDVARLAFIVPSPSADRLLMSTDPDTVAAPVQDGVAVLPLQGDKPVPWPLDLAGAGPELVGSVLDLQALDIPGTSGPNPVWQPPPPEPIPPELTTPSGLAVVGTVALAMIASLGTGAWLATNKARGGVWVGGTGRIRRWPWSLTAVVLALVVWPLVLLGSGWTMATWSLTHPEYDVSGMVLAMIPPLVVSGVAVLCAHAGVNQSREQAQRRRPAVAAAVVAWVVAGLQIALLGLILSYVGGSGG